MSLKTIGTFYNVIDAQIAKSKLESSGIKCFLLDDNMSGACSNVTGGARVQVLEEDARTAETILHIEKLAQEPSMSKTSTLVAVSLMLLLITFLVFSYGGIGSGGLAPNGGGLGCVNDML